MKKESSQAKPVQAKKVADLHWDCRHWKSTIRFVKDEITFLDHLLNSYVFEPNTPKMFESIQDFLRRLKKAKEKKDAVVNRIAHHENDLGGMLECIDDACDIGFYKKHNVLKAEVVGCADDFRNLKTEIFKYAGAILKSRKRGLD